MQKIINLTEVRNSKLPDPQRLVDDFNAGKLAHISITTMDVGGTVSQYKFTYDSSAQQRGSATV